MPGDACVQKGARLRVKMMIVREWLLEQEARQLLEQGAGRADGYWCRELNDSWSRELDGYWREFFVHLTGCDVQRLEWTFIEIFDPPSPPTVNKSKSS